MRQGELSIEEKNINYRQQSESILSIDGYKPTKAINSNLNGHNTNIFNAFHASKYEGKILSFMGAITTALIITGFKYLFNHSMPAPQALIARYLFPFLASIALNFYMKCIKKYRTWNCFAKDRRTFCVLSIRSILHWTANIFIMYSLVYINMVLDNAIFYLWPIFGLFLTYFILKESVTISDVLLSFCGLAGVIIMLDPNFEAFSSLKNAKIEGFILVFCGAFFYAANMAILRKLSIDNVSHQKIDYHWTQTEAVAGLWSTLALTPILIACLYFVFDVSLNEIVINLNLFEWNVWILCGLMSFLAIGGISRAIQCENIMVVGTILYVEVPCGILFQAVLLNNTQNFDTIGLWLGMVMIVVSTMLLMYSTHDSKSKPSAKNNNEHKFSVEILSFDSSEFESEIESKNVLERQKILDDEKIIGSQDYGSVE